MKLARFGVSLVLGLAITTGLLILMFTLIKMGNVDIEDKGDTKIVDIWQEETEIEDKTKVLKPEKPEDPDEPPPPMPTDTTDIKDVTDVVQMNTPRIDANATISLGGFGGDGEYIPLVKIAPNYPRRAAERGIEGYVVIEFTLSTTGTVLNPRVVEAFDTKNRPTTMFNREALKAAAKLKYKPRVIDGTPVEVPGVLHKFTFQLEK